MVKFLRRHGAAPSPEESPEEILFGSDDDAQEDPDSDADATIRPRNANQPSGWFWSATVAVGLLVLVVGVAGVKSWADLRFSQTRADELQQEVETVDDSVRRLEERIHLLRSNSELLERVAREELGVVRPDEVVVILP